MDRRLARKNIRSGLIARNCGCHVDDQGIRSAVEFGDKVVREVMTPRPEMIAISGTVTLEELLQLIEEHPVSRVPVYDGTIDHITGSAFACID